MRKTLLLIGSSLNCGAPGKISEQIGILAQKKGWVVYQAHGLRHSNPSKLNTIPLVTPFEEKIQALYSFLFDRHGLGPESKTKELVNWIKKNNPEIIHLHNIHGHFLNYKVLFDYLRETEIPVVWTLHDFWPITGHCVHFDHIGCELWKTHCEKCSLNNTYPKTILFRRTFQNFSIKRDCFTSLKNMTIVPVSNWEGSLLKESFLAKYQIKTIYNGVDTNVFKYRESSLRKSLDLIDKKILLGVASPWSERKGYSDYIKLRVQLPDNYIIIMVGVTNKEIKNLPNGIIGIERTQNQIELAEYYSMADIVLNLSSQETFGMTTVEAMACGTPVIVYNKTASPELVTKETGKIVTAGMIDELLVAIHEIIDKGTFFYQESCRQRALLYFDKDKCFAEYINLYNDLLKKQLSHF